MALVEVLWGRVKEAVDAKPQGHKSVQRALESMQKARNKNTYTKWLSPKFSGRRPDIRISDLEDLAAALNVAPAGLLSSNGGPPTPIPQQQELPFEPGSQAVKLKMECSATGIIVRSVKD
jgi:hypothetical protein